MKINYNIAIIGGKYLHEIWGDGPYYHLFELTTDNLQNHPPKLYTDDDMNEFTSDFEMYDEVDGKTFSSLDILFKEIVIEI